MISRKFPKIGELYSRISHKVDDEHYHNCVIKNIEKRKNRSGNFYFLIYILYDYSSGNIFDKEVDDEVGEFLEGEEVDELQDELNSSGSNFRTWYDNEVVECVETEEGNLSLNYNRYNFYK
jgi:hypothetical protein